MKTNAMTPKLGPVLQQFFVERLMQQRRASGCTVAANRDCFRLLLGHAQQRLGKRPSDIALQDINAALVLDFLSDLEKRRHNSARTRNARFAAIRSFMHYAGLKEPAALAVTQSVLAIPMKRFDRPLIGFLTREQIEAIIGAPDAKTWTGQRDRVMFTTLYNTGARVSELIGMRVCDFQFGSSAAMLIHGKSRKERSVPLWANTAALIRQWLRASPRALEDPMFPNRSGTPLTRTSVAERLQLAVTIATTTHPELTKHRVTPHIWRHSIAMHLLQAGVDITVIALWLGHESTATTHMYVEADLAMKERALSRLPAPHGTRHRYRPPDRVLNFLQTL
ncbi:MAG: tyrosine-type recombinase/integrase [Phycisphaerae bacterium]|nr:tyrosine-type recombinase/integrase [Phycisphaerae bacterium]MDZ4779374.1 tyrosine-type recombinase/integrase [Planctomycetia bacterium]